MDISANNQLLGLRLAAIRELQDAEDHWDHHAFVLRDVADQLEARIKAASLTREQLGEIETEHASTDAWKALGLPHPETIRALWDKFPDDDPSALIRLRDAKQADADRFAELAKVAGACWRARADRVKADFAKDLDL